MLLEFCGSLTVRPLPRPSRSQTATAAAAAAARTGSRRQPYRLGGPHRSSPVGGIHQPGTLWPGTGAAIVPH
jgi:hypothetical protein